VAWCRRDAGWTRTQSRVWQNDFFQGGAMPLPDAERILPIIARLRRTKKFDVVIISGTRHLPQHRCRIPCTRACQRGRHPSRATIVHDVCDADDSAPTILLRTCTKNSPRRTAMHFTCGQVSVSSGLKDPSSILRSPLPQQTSCCTRACCTSHNLVRATAFAGQPASFVTHRVCCRHRERL